MIINSAEIIKVLIIYLRIFIFRIIDPTINWDNLANVTWCQMWGNRLVNFNFVLIT